MTSTAMSPNHREALTAVSSITGKDEYLFSTNHVLNSTATISGQTIPATGLTTAVAVQIVDGSGNQIASFGGGTQYAELITTSPGTGNLSLGRYKSSPPVLTDGQMYGLQLDTSGNLKVTGSLSVGGTTDNSAFTAGSSTGTPSMGFYHSTIDTVTDGRAATVGITSKRAMFANLQSSAGTELLGQKAMAGSIPIVIASDQASIPVVATLSAETTKVIGTVNQGTSPWVTSNATTSVVGNGAAATAQRVTIANDSTGVLASIGSITSSIVPGTAATNLGKAEDGVHSTGDVGVMALAVRNDNGAVFAGSDGDYIPLATDGTGALRVDLNGTISTNNSTTAVLAGGATFTGTSEDALNYNEIRISVIASHISATDGLSIQQSEDNTNWDFTDTYTIPAATGKTYSIPRQARYFRVVYTNGATLQTSFRLQAIMNRLGARVSSQRPNDAYTNETDLEQQQSFLMGYNGTTWDRIRTVGTGVVSTSTVLTTGSAAIGSLTAGSAIIGKVGIDQTTPGTTNLVALAANQSVNLAQVGGGTTQTGSGTATGAQRVEIANNGTGTLATVSTVTTVSTLTGTTTLTPGTGASNLGKAEDAAHTTADVGVMALAVSNDTLAATVNASADYTQISTDRAGIVITAGAPRALKGRQATTITSSTAETTIVTAVGSTFLDVYGLILTNTSATVTKVSVRDATAGGTITVFEVPATDTRGFMLPLDSAIPQAAVNNNWTAQCGTSVSALEVTVLYVKRV